MMLSNVIVDITISSRSFLFHQSDVQIPAGLTNISGLAVTAFDLIAPCLSPLGSSLSETTESTGTLLNALPTVWTTVNESLWKAGLLT